MSLASLVRRFGGPLRGVHELGRDAVVRGRPWIKNEGTIRIGRGFAFGSSPSVSHLVTGPGGRLTVGDGVAISYGAAVSVQQSLDIGDGTRIGPFCVIMDSDFHAVGDRLAAAEMGPIVIGRNVSIGSRVTILRNTTIGDGARILAGSVVSGVVPAGAVFGGVPARAVSAPKPDTADASVNLLELVQRVLGLSSMPQGKDGPDTIAEWDSLGSLKLLLAIEEAYLITLVEDEMRAARSLDAVAEVVERALARAERQSTNFETNRT